MVKVYLHDRAHWFKTEAEAAQFMRDNPAATMREFSQYWNGKTKQWEVKP